MILQALVNHYEDLAKQEKVPKKGWCHAKVSYALDIGRDGSLLGIISLKQEEIRGKKAVWVAQPKEVPEMVSRSSGVSANFLCDNSKYMLGIDSDGSGSRIRECFEAAKKKHLSILTDVHSVAAEAVKNFFQYWDPEYARENTDISDKWEDVTAGGNLLFYVEGIYAQEDEDIREAWQKDIDNKDGDMESVCLVTGKKAGISRIHSAIKGVSGAQSSGALLVSFNAPSFESYGKEQSYNAPVGKYAAFAYTTALNYLLSQREYTFMLGDTTILFWAEGGEEIYQRLFEMCAEPVTDNQEVIKSIFLNLQKGHAIDIEGIEIKPEQKFYILGLAPNAARLSVRFFYQDSFGNILANLRKHYERMDIIRPSWDDQRYLGIWRMLMETVNHNSRDKKPQPNMAAVVFRSILANGRYPENLYEGVMIRIRAEQGSITRGRAGIIKAYLIRNYNDQLVKEEEFMGLNEQCSNTAYILGREFAVLEAIQQEANPGINATIRDRYFNSACATPASIFPILLKLKNSHIRKIENKKIYFEKKLTELQGKIDVSEDCVSAYPHRLSLEEQGMFILGYYHQVQKRFEKKEDK